MVIVCPLLSHYIMEQHGGTQRRTTRTHHIMEQHQSGVQDKKPHSATSSSTTASTASSRVLGATPRRCASSTFFSCLSSRTSSSASAIFTSLGGNKLRVLFRGGTQAGPGLKLGDAQLSTLLGLSYCSRRAL